MSQESKSAPDLPEPCSEDPRHTDKPERVDAIVTPEPVRAKLSVQRS